jgi:hypothetical protein
MGLEPTTFCMARNGREQTATATSRQTRIPPRLALRPSGQDAPAGDSQT